MSQVTWYNMSQWERQPDSRIVKAFADRSRCGSMGVGNKAPSSRRIVSVYVHLT
jgi:hypothetical protein